MTVEKLLEKYKRKYPGVPYKINLYSIISQKNNKLHSYGDAPAEVGVDEGKSWYKEGKLHRENDKPAVIYDEAKQWYYHGKLHRENDKPAIISLEGEKSYYYHGKEYDPTDTPEKRKNI